jgi:hypothetical protein
MPKRCIVNVSIGGWYPKGQQRLRTSVKKHSPGIDIVEWTDNYPAGCPPHITVPYAFKPYAFKAAKDQGYTSVLWLDSAAWAVRPLEPFFEAFEQEGHFFQLNGWRNGNWCSDAALKTLGYTRDEMMEISHIMACIIGLDFTKECAVEFFDEYLRLANDGVTFHGAWKNDQKQVSADDRVLGHRHDQTAASAVIHRLGIPIAKLAALHYQGAYAKDPSKKVPDHVYFLSRGGVTW